MQKYELMLIVNPSIAEEEREKSLSDLKELFKKNSVSIVSEDIWWEKKLAYKINRSEKGFYVLYDVDLDGKSIKDLTKTINLDTNIWRHMFVKKES